VITRIRSKRMVVISDLHIGNPFSGVRRKTVDFIHWASSSGYDICLNGDGFDVAQVSLSRLTQDLPEVLQALKNAAARGRSVYYVVGNHDILFEHFLNDWGGVQLAPFLNVDCGAARFRVEHGHLYDPFFIAYPRLYDFSTWLAGFALKVHPSLYRSWIAFEKFMGRKRGIAGERASFLCAAAKLEERGFDGVVFGHTHHRGVARLPLGGAYLNPGSWMLSSTYVTIENGVAELREFCPSPGGRIAG